MAKFEPNQYVYVPSTLLPDGDREIFAMVRKRVNSVTDRSIRLDLPAGAVSNAIGSSRAHAKLGFALISIGDFSSETGLIGPLTKSVLQFCRLLISDDHIVQITVRSMVELGAWWDKNHKAFTHIVLIGHGDSQAIYFGVDGACSPADFDAALSPAEADRKLFVSLCCENGQAPFASAFSNLPFCGELIAPEQSIHGAAASQFLQTMLTLHLLHGKSKKVAFNNINDLLPGSDTFAMWRKGAQLP